VKYGPTLAELKNASSRQLNCAVEQGEERIPAFALNRRLPPMKVLELLDSARGGRVPRVRCWSNRRYAHVRRLRDDLLH
jgi:hypothetical protein